MLAVILSGANVVGYTKCSREASQQVRDMAKRAVATGLTVSSLTVCSWSPLDDITYASGSPKS